MSFWKEGFWKTGFWKFGFWQESGGAAAVVIDFPPNRTTVIGKLHRTTIVGNMPRTVIC